MTINQLLNDETISQKIQDASISPVSITMWINDFELQNSYLLRTPVYTKLYYPEHKDKQLLLSEEYTNMYILYLSAMIDFFSGDMEEYNKSAMDFKMAYDDFRYNVRGFYNAKN